MRRASKIDDNQTAIVEALREAGYKVQSLAAVGNGCPDLLVGVNGRNVLIEVKDGDKCLSERLLTPMQKVWHTEWTGTAHVAESVEQAMLIVAHYRKWKAA